jgi:hypothetical protein
MDEIRRLTVRGSETIVSEDALSAESLEAIMEGSGNIDLLVNTTRMVSRTDGSGSIRLRGEATEHTATIQGSGSINAFDLATRKTTVTVSGSGSAEVFVTEKLDVTVEGSGNVRYRGDPANVNQKISGSGTVSKA